MPPRDIGSAYLKAFGRAVRARRDAIDLSQESLSFASKLHRTYISGIERGSRNPTLKIIVRLAQALDIEPDQLLAAAQEFLRKAR